MKDCYVVVILVILCAITIGIIGYNSGDNQKQIIELRHQNQKFEFLLQEERNNVEELKEKLSASFTISVEIQ